jgi:hypothetical protein
VPSRIECSLNPNLRDVRERMVRSVFPCQFELRIANIEQEEATTDEA